MGVSGAFGSPDSGAGAGGQAAGQQVPAERVAAAAAAPAAPLDPLSQSEIQQAKDLATASAVSQLRTNTALRAQGQPEVLVAEQRSDKNDAVRQADVYLYDYATNKGVHAVVDLTGNKVKSLTSERGLQPPASKAETVRATQILMDDARLGPKLRAMYKDATGQELTGPNDLWSQALVFKAKRATGMEGAVRAASECGDHRCFQLFLRVPGGKWVDTARLVIDMSARRVLAFG